MESPPLPATGSAGPDPPAGASPTYADAAAPDWAAFEGEIDCPLCGYSLRGLIEPRCPECGYRFDWPGIIAARSNLHPYLFEHHPERNARSFVATFVGALRPRTFWSGLHPGHRFNVRRLMAYALTPLLFAFAAWLTVCVGDAYLKYPAHSAAVAWQRARTRSWVMAAKNQEYQQEMIKLHGSVDAYIDHYYPVDPAWRFVLRLAVGGHIGLAPFASAISILLWPSFSLAALLIFQVSLRRARLRWMHVLRCVAYTFDVSCWGAALSCVCMWVLTSNGIIDNRWNPLLLSNELVTNAIYYPVLWPGSMNLRALIATGAWVALGIIWIWSIWRLLTAYRIYLKFHASYATVATSQFMVLLLMIILRTQLRLRFGL